jgi:hypothetical protein
MSALFELEEVTETRVEWEPVWHLGIESEGWHWDREWSLPLNADGSPITEAEWKAYYKRTHLCRDCGSPGNHNRGGAADGRGYSLCDDCADVDGKWGRSVSGDERDRLFAVQARRRARYLKAVTS